MLFFIKSFILLSTIIRPVSLCPMPFSKSGFINLMIIINVSLTSCDSQFENKRGLIKVFGLSSFD